MSFLAPFHPVFVHFPIALLIGAGLIEVLALALRRPTLHVVSLWNLVLGTLGAGMAFLSGEQAEELAEHAAAAHQVLQWHETLGRTTLIVAVLVTLLRLVTRDRLAGWLRIVSVSLMLAAVGSVAAGGYLGGRLVYEFGLGTPSAAAHRASGAHEHDQPHHHDDE